ncbi:hypothetical protein [Saccharicrinis fermentans]|uniref:Uncharacterized protein n=1 Tax=Saccharicrinis fermentans DSM 9555 = JCM 21142 TaxID=869213 RepID=W7YC02_9BACT|nr:hypothetical protein [Saccharicrinis fermentans]GAF05992.1 hypothetical protein JCM21142_134759 [Saccharicrinis fermentans DSM 9555 = JCM 21142]
MTKLNFTDNDFKEARAIAELIKKIDQIDADYVNSVSDEIYKLQPFYLTVLLGHRLDVSMEELEEIMKIYFLVWEYFRLKPNLQRKQVTESLYSKIQKRNLEMLKYSEGELKDIDKKEVYSYDLQNLKSKSLLTAIMYRFKERRMLINMDFEKKGAIMIGIKSFIECFEML